jgi:hypothetical protein
MYYLKRYVKGKALSAISSFISGSNANAYYDAKAVLDKRYGSSFRISEAYRKKLDEWPKVPPKDGQALRDLSDFLLQCKSNMEAIPELSFLNDKFQKQRLLQLLPDYLISKWNQKVVDYEETHSAFPPFEYFVNFMDTQAQMACHPVTSLEVVKQKKPVPKSAISHSVSRSGYLECCMCKSGHRLFECPMFKGLDQSARYQTVLDNRLCFNCLQSGHGARFCTSSHRCQVCSHNHHTLLHKSSPEPQVNDSSSTGQDKANCGSVQHSCSGQLCSMIVPVWVSTKSNPSKRWLTYAMLDTQSDASFLSEDVASRLDGKSVSTSLQLSTMTSKQTILKCNKFTDLIIQGYHESEVIELPGSYTRKFIPHNEDHFPTAEIARRWAHLSSIADSIEPSMKCSVGLLIGYNCSEALAPLDVLRGGKKEPYAVRTALGWSIVGRVQSSSQPSKLDSTSLSHRIVSTEVSMDWKICRSSKSHVSANKLFHQKSKPKSRTRFLSCQKFKSNPVMFSQFSNQPLGHHRPSRRLCRGSGVVNVSPADPWVSEFLAWIKKLRECYMLDWRVWLSGLSIMSFIQFLHIFLLKFFCFVYFLAMNLLRDLRNVCRYRLHPCCLLG